MRKQVSKGLESAAPDLLARSIVGGGRVREKTVLGDSAG